MAPRGRAPLKVESAPALLYTGQDVARFCEVDLKTIHHWADRGKIPHHRTEGRHLRFRRNDVVRFLRAHGYPLSEELTAVRAQTAVAPVAVPAPAVEVPEGESAPPVIDPDEQLAKRLAGRFVVRRHASAVTAIARALGDGVDALVLGMSDPTIAGARTISALKGSTETAYLVLVAVGEGPALEEARAAGAELAVAPRDLGGLARELARVLGVS